MLILCAGGRRFFDTMIVNKTMNNLLKEFGSFTIVHGGASGADNIVDHWAREHEIERIVVNADWDQYKHAAGPIRNKQMIEMKPDLVILFPGGKGTANTAFLAIEAKIPVRRISPNIDTILTMFKRQK